MKLNKIKTGIATLAAVATIFGYSMLARAEDKKPIQFESTGVQVEIGSDHGKGTDMTSIKETLDLKLKHKDITINITGSHTDYTGKLENEKTKGNSNSIRVEANKKINENLSIAPYAEFKDDIDPVRELRDDKVSSVSLGISGEYLLKKPFTLIGDFKASYLTKDGPDYAESLGIMYYFNDDWISLKGVNWNESLRDTSTAMGYVTFNHKFSEKLEGRIHAGIGKEYGKRDETVSDIGAKVSYKINEKVSIGVGYDQYNRSKSKRHTVGIGLTWRF